MSYTTHPIYVKNIGNVSVSKQITVTIKYLGQVIQTWTANAPAAGQRVRSVRSQIGTETALPSWMCMRSKRSRSTRRSRCASASIRVRCPAIMDLHGGDAGKK